MGNPLPRRFDMIETPSAFGSRITVSFDITRLELNYSARRPMEDLKIYLCAAIDAEIRRFVGLPPRPPGDFIDAEIVTDEPRRITDGGGAR